ncbi:MAG: acetate--CoA ligase family protein [Chloroflexi bacterium]|nr:acetate--CoA ligase family protein [Chloroflexota bacterium]
MSVATIVEQARKEQRTLLSEIEAKELLKEAQITSTAPVLVKSPDEAVKLARQAGFPVVMKIDSPDITHKSDVGGVKLNLHDEAAVRGAWGAIMDAVKKAAPQARINGLTVQKQARPGVEVIIGMTKDPQFGPVLMFGLGGVLVEILKDVAFRIVPLTQRDAAQMVREIKGFPLLQGYRGSEPADVACLEGLLLRLSDFVDKHPEIREIDLNPIFAYKDGAVAVDARVILEPPGS